MSNYGATELFVSNFVGIQEELQQLFGAHGSVQEFWISQKKGVKVPVGTPGLYGVVRMATHEEAFMAKKALNNTTVNGKIMSVRWAANVRVLWVGQLAPSVTNLVLEAAFAQFGPVAKAVVVCETQSNTSRRFGFVAFERKEDCARALAMCGKNMFLIGNSARPVVVEMARTEDTDEGFIEEEMKAKSEGMAPPLGLPAHFALEGTAEHSIAQYGGARTAMRDSLADTEAALLPRALQLRQAQAQYREARAALRQGLADTEAALLRGVAPSTLALQPAMRAPPVMAPAVGNGQTLAPWVTAASAGPPDQDPASPGGRHRDRRSYSPPRRRHEDFSHVAPPKRLRPARGFDDNRYTPRSAHDSVPPPDVAAGAAPPARSSAGFVRGGTLGTVAKDGTIQLQSPTRQAHGHTTAPAPPTEQANEDGTAQQLLPGTKPLGSHDHGGIGFSGEHPAEPPPPSSVYIHGQSPMSQTSQPVTSAYISGGMQPAPPSGPHPGPTPSHSAPLPNYPPQGPAPPQGPPPSHYPPPQANSWQRPQAGYQQQAWGAPTPQAAQAYYGGMVPGLQSYGQQAYGQQYSTPTYMAPGGRGAGYNGRGRGY